MRAIRTARTHGSPTALTRNFFNADWSLGKVRDPQQPLRVVYAGNIGEGQGLHAILPQLALRLGGTRAISG